MKKLNIMAFAKTYYHIIRIQLPISAYVSICSTPQLSPNSLNRDDRKGILIKKETFSRLQRVVASSNFDKSGRARLESVMG